MPDPSPLSPSQTRLQKAKFALDVGRAKDAVPLLLQALSGAESNEEGTNVMWYLARAFEKQNDWETALQWSERAASSAPEDASLHWLKGDLLEKLNRRKEAEDAANEAVRLEPEMAAAHYLLFRVYRNTQPDKALVCAKQFRELSPQEPAAFYALAELALTAAEKAGNEKREINIAAADDYLRQGLALDPENGFLFRLSGRLHEIQNRPVDAIFAYMEAARLRPESHEERKNLRKATDTLFTGSGWPADKPYHRWLWAVCALLHGAGFWVGMGAFLTFGIGYALFVVYYCVVYLFPVLVLSQMPLFKRLPRKQQERLKQAAYLLHRSWHEKGEIFLLPSFFSLVINFPFLVMRGIWWIVHLGG